MPASKYGTRKKTGTIFQALFWLVILVNVQNLLSEAQERPQKFQQPRAAYRVTVNAITIAVTVQDKKGRYVNDLGQRISLFMRTANGKP